MDGDLGVSGAALLATGRLYGAEIHAQTARGSGLREAKGESDWQQEAHGSRDCGDLHLKRGKSSPSGSSAPLTPLPARTALELSRTRARARLDAVERGAFLTSSALRPPHVVCPCQLHLGVRDPAAAAPSSDKSPSP